MNCQKEVVDFTTCSDEQILNYFSNASGKQCGRFHPMQLDKNIVPIRHVERPSVLKIFFSSLLVLLGLREGVAQEKSDSRTIVQTTNETGLSQLKPKRAELPDPFAIDGVVVDSVTGEFLIGASVILDGSSIGCSTDLDGRFSLTIPENYRQDRILVKVAFIGYETKQFYFAPNNPSEKIELALNTESVILGGCFYDPVPLVDKMETLKVKTWLKSIGHW